MCNEVCKWHCKYDKLFVVPKPLKNIHLNHFLVYFRQIKTRILVFYMSFFVLKLMSTKLPYRRQITKFLFKYQVFFLIAKNTNNIHWTLHFDHIISINDFEKNMFYIHFGQTVQVKWHVGQRQANELDAVPFRLNILNYQIGCIDPMRVTISTLFYGFVVDDKILYVIDKCNKNNYKARNKSKHPIIYYQY